jgi:aminoglycoside phosphotransferase (APT) family kinase protein
VLIHGEFVGYNVLLADERVIVILDFDRLAVRERVHDVAYTLMYVLSRLVDGWREASGAGVGDGDLAAAARLLGAYDAASGWPLTAAELRALPFDGAGAAVRDRDGGRG